MAISVFDQVKSRLNAATAVAVAGLASLSGTLIGHRPEGQDASGDTVSVTVRFTGTGVHQLLSTRLGSAVALTLGSDPTSYRGTLISSHPDAADPTGDTAILTLRLSQTKS